MRACDKHHLETVQVLLLHPYIDVNAQDQVSRDMFYSLINSLSYYPGFKFGLCVLFRTAGLRS